MLRIVGLLGGVDGGSPPVNARPIYRLLYVHRARDCPDAARDSLCISTSSDSAWPSIPVDEWFNPWPSTWPKFRSPWQLFLSSRSRARQEETITEDESVMI